jgi:hypothetical protein
VVAAEVSCALIGGGLLAVSLYQRSRLQASQSWQQVMGTITKAEVEIVRDADSSGYQVSVLYEYEVNGVRYMGKRIRFSDRSHARKKRAQAELDLYPVNSSVTVFFDPAKPSDAVLSREYPDRNMLMFFGVGLLVLAAVILLFGSN